MRPVNNSWRICMGRGSNSWLRDCCRGVSLKRSPCRRLEERGRILQVVNRINSCRLRRQLSQTPAELPEADCARRRPLNKQVGLKLGISEITVKAHGGKMMQKMKADSLADLVKMAVRFRLAPARNPWHVLPEHR